MNAAAIRRFEHGNALLHVLAFGTYACPIGGCAVCGKGDKK